MKMKKMLYWSPRVLAVLFIIFISMFALDVFGEGYGFPEVLVALFMHLVPTFLLTAATVVAWKREKLGGLIFILLGVFYISMTWGKFELLTYLTISGPSFIIGALFMLNGKLNRSRK
jgi:hypothetical protein